MSATPSNSITMVDRSFVIWAKTLSNEKIVTDDSGLDSVERDDGHIKYLLIVNSAVLH